MGFAISSMYQALGPRFATTHVTTVAEALAWLECDAGALAADLARLTAECDAVEQLRALLADGPRTMRLNEAASILGLPVRSIQRALSIVGSSFREELDRACVARVSELLTTTADKIETIARRLGVASSSLSRIFRRYTGESPTRFRERTRLSR